MSDDVVIRTAGLTKRYGARLAVDHLDLEVGRGAICGFLGPNGAGKTTTIRMLLGLVRPTSGTAEVLGAPVSRRGSTAARVGAIVETPAFYPYLTARQNLEVFARCSLRPVTSSRLGELLRQVGLEGRDRERVATYSMGMKQRLGLAAALLTDPELLFLDEPTNGLDPAGMQEIRELIAALASGGRTIFLSSHQLSEVQQVCTDVVILQAGVKRLQGKVSDVLAQKRRVAFRVSPQEKAAAVLTSLAGPPQPDGPALLVTAPPERVPELVRALVAAGVDVLAVEERLPTLEERFLEITGAAA